jgi:hypothetical protein
MTAESRPRVPGGCSPRPLARRCGSATWIADPHRDAVEGLEGAEQTEEAVAERLAHGFGDLADQHVEHLGDGGVTAQGGVGHDVEHLAAEHALLAEDAADERKPAVVAAEDAEGPALAAEETADERKTAFATEEATDERKTAFATEEASDERKTDAVQDAEGPTPATEEVTDEGKTAASEDAEGPTLAAEETADERKTALAAEETAGKVGRDDVGDAIVEERGVSRGTHTGKAESKRGRDDSGATGGFRHGATPSGGTRGRVA